MDLLIEHKKEVFRKTAELYIRNSVNAGRGFRRQAYAAIVAGVSLVSGRKIRRHREGQLYALWCYREFCHG